MATPIQLTAQELHQLDTLRPWPGESWRLWKSIGDRVGVDFTDGRLELQQLCRGHYTVRKTPLKLKRRPAAISI